MGSVDEKKRMRDLLKKLRELRDFGALSEEEYEEKRKVLVERLRELEESEGARRYEKPRILLLATALALILVGLVMSIMPSTTLIIKPTATTLASPTTYTTTLTGTFIQEDSAAIPVGEMMIIVVPAYEMYSWPSLLKDQTATRSMTVTATAHVWERALEIGGKKYQFLSDSPRLICGYIESDQPINFYILDSENYIRFLEHGSFSSIYSAEQVVGKKEISFTPPEISRMERFEKLRVIFQNLGSQPASISYRLDTLWDVKITEVRERVTQTTTTIQQTTFPYMGLGIILLIIGVATAIIYAVSRRRL